MSTVDAIKVINDASVILNDIGATRWTTDELLSWLNAGQVELALLVPSTNTKTTSIQLVQGAKQSLPADSIRGIEFVRNAGSNGTTFGNAIRQIEREIMDRYVPGWSSSTPATTVIHTMYDAEDNNSVFYVYPPQTSSPQYIEIIYSVIPATVANANIGTKITVQDYYANALTDYIIYRSMMKDSKYANNQQEAQARYQAFSSAIGLKTKADIAANQE